MAYSLHNFTSGDILMASELNEMDAQIMNNTENSAKMETSSATTKNYSVGEYLVYNGMLHEVTAAIANGGTITPGTNCDKTNVGTELTAIKNTLTHKAGDTIQLTGTSVVAGLVNSAGTQVSTFIPLSKPISASSVSASGTFNVRNGSALTQYTASNLSGEIRPNGVVFAFTLSSSIGSSGSAITVGPNVTLTFA